MAEQVDATGEEATSFFQTFKIKYEGTKDPHMILEQPFLLPEEELQLRTVKSASEQIKTLENELLNALASSSNVSIDQVWRTLKHLAILISRRPQLSPELQSAISHVLVTIITLWQQEDLPNSVPSPYQAVAFLDSHSLMTTVSWRECLISLANFDAESFFSAGNDLTTSEQKYSYRRLAQLLGLWRLFLGETRPGDDVWCYQIRAGEAMALWTNIPTAFAIRTTDSDPRNSFLEQFFSTIPVYRRSRQLTQGIGDCFLTTLSIIHEMTPSYYFNIRSTRKVAVFHGLSPRLATDFRSFLTLSALIATSSHPNFPLRRSDLAYSGLSAEMKARVGQSVTAFCSKASVVLGKIVHDVYIPRLDDDPPVRQNSSPVNPNKRHVDSYFAKIYRKESIQAKLNEPPTSSQVEWAIRETSRATSEPLARRVLRVFNFYTYRNLYSSAMIVWRAFNHVLRFDRGFMRVVLKLSRRTREIEVYERLWAEFEEFCPPHFYPQWIERLSVLVRGGEVERAAKAFVLLLRRAESAQDLLATTGWITKEHESFLALMQKNSLIRDFIRLLITEGEDVAAFELLRLIQSSSQIKFSPDASLVYLLLDCALKNGLFDEANAMTQELRSLGVRLREEQAAAVFAADMLSWPMDLAVPAIKQRLTGAMKLVHPNAGWPEFDAAVPRTMNPVGRFVETLARGYTTFVEQVAGYCDSKLETTKFVLAAYDHALTVGGLPYFHMLFQNMRIIFSNQLRQNPRLGIMLSQNKMPGVSRERDIGVDYLLSFYLSSGNDTGGDELRHRLRNSRYARDLIRELIHKKPGFDLSENQVWDLMPVPLGRKKSMKGTEEALMEDYLTNVRQSEDTAWKEHEETIDGTDSASKPSKRVNRADLETFAGLSQAGLGKSRLEAGSSGFSDLGTEPAVRYVSTKGYVDKGNVDKGHVDEDHETVASATPFLAGQTSKHTDNTMQGTEDFFPFRNIIKGTNSRNLRRQLDEFTFFRHVNLQKDETSDGTEDASQHVQGPLAITDSPQQAHVSPAVEADNRNGTLPSASVKTSQENRDSSEAAEPSKGLQDFLAIANAPRKGVMSASTSRRTANKAPSTAGKTTLPQQATGLKDDSFNASHGMQELLAVSDVPKRRKTSPTTLQKHKNPGHTSSAALNDESSAKSTSAPQSVEETYHYQAQCTEPPDAHEFSRLVAAPNFHSHTDQQPSEQSTINDKNSVADGIKDLSSSASPPLTESEFKSEPAPEAEPEPEPEPEKASAAGSGGG